MHRSNTHAEKYDTSNCCRNSIQKAKEILELIEHIKCEVYKKFNKKIELEIQILGE